uniref:EexN family lipoprotein n=1 Tax=Enterobacter sp. TaxID=42895 RepID=UPI00296F8ED3|nr:EexN family lipoprotein [Enterobacter sp.]
MKMGLVSLSLMTSVLLTGCDAGAKSLEWYKAHDKERTAKFEECRKSSDPRGTEDCRNAIDATVHRGSFTKSRPYKSWEIKQPPLGGFFTPVCGHSVKRQ